MAILLKEAFKKLFTLTIESQAMRLNFYEAKDLLSISMVSMLSNSLICKQPPQVHKQPRFLKAPF
jgi:hypothetical protein